MSMIFGGDTKTTYAIKSAMQQYVAANRIDATSHELTQLYATSVTLGQVADFRGNMIAQIPMRVKINGKIVDEKNPIYSIFRRGAGYSDLAKRTEITMIFWGRNLLWKDRNAFNVPRKLTWINPNIYMLDVYSMHGLRGFRLMQARGYSNDLPDERYIDLEDAVYVHGIDFDDDFDGVGEAERAFLEASVEPERAQTLISTFRNMGIPAGIVQPTEGGGDMKPEERSGLAGMLRRVTEGAQNAGRTIVSARRYEWRQMQSALKDMDLSPIAREARESICFALGVPMSLIQSNSSSYAELEGLRRVWAHAWLVPRAEWYAQELTEQLGRDPFLIRAVGGDIVIEPDLDAVPFLKEDAASRVNVVNAKVMGGLMSLYDAQVAAGEKPRDEFRDLYNVPGIGVLPAAEVMNVWREKILPTPPSSFGALLGSTSSAPPQVDDAPRVLPDQPKDVEAALGVPAPQKAVSKAAYVTIPLADHDDLLVAQYKLRRALEGVDGVEWQSPATFHITLVYSEYVPDVMLQSVIAALRTQPALLQCDIEGGALGVFESGDERALCVQVHVGDEVRALQAAVYAAFDERHVPLSAYSEAAAWKPHITLAYFPREIDVPDVRVGLHAHVSKIQISRADHEHVATMTLARRLGDLAVKSKIPDAQRKELTDWRRIVARKSAAYAFETVELPGMVAAMIRMALEDGEPPGDVFDEAEAWLAGFGVKSYEDTSAAFVQEMIRIIGEGQRSEVSRQKFGGQMRSALRRYGLIAFSDGRAAEGGDIESISIDELKVFRAWQAETSAFITGFGAEIFKEGGINDAEIAIRADMWADKSLRDVRYRGAALVAPKKLKRWKRNPAKDSCDDCLARDGQVMTFEEWEQIGLPGDQRLACHGFFCGCTLEDA